MQRIIFHIDVNSAFLSWSAVKMVREGKPDIRLVPSVVSGDPSDRRSIITAASIPAKKLGIIAAGFSQVEITPFHPEVVPYKAEEDSLPEVPELNLQYTPVATYPDPVWQRDSTDTE